MKRLAICLLLVLGMSAAAAPVQGKINLGVEITATKGNDAKLTHVDNDSIGWRLGLRVEDTVLSVNGAKVTGAADARGRLERAVMTGGGYKVEVRRFFLANKEYRTMTLSGTIGSDKGGPTVTRRK